MNLLGKGITVILSDLFGNKIEYDHDLVFQKNDEFFKKQQSFEKLEYFMNNGIPDEVNLYLQTKYEVGQIIVLNLMYD